MADDVAVGATVSGAEVVEVEALSVCVGVGTSIPVAVDGTVVCASTPTVGVIGVGPPTSDSGIVGSVFPGPRGVGCTRPGPKRRTNTSNAIAAPARAKDGASRKRSANAAKKRVQVLSCFTGCRPTTLEAETLLAGRNSEVAEVCSKVDVRSLAASANTSRRNRSPSSGGICRWGIFFWKRLRSS